MRAYDIGIEAGKAGETIQDNPYREIWDGGEENENHFSWLCGFYDARNECMDCKEGYYPIYGLAPHSHDIRRTRSIIGSNVTDPKENWPDNFSEDPDALGCGVYVCPKCPEKKEEYISPEDKKLLESIYGKPGGGKC